MFSSSGLSFLCFFFLSFFFLSFFFFFLSHFLSDSSTWAGSGYYSLAISVLGKASSSGYFTSGFSSSSTIMSLFSVFFFYFSLSNFFIWDIASSSFCSFYDSSFFSFSFFSHFFLSFLTLTFSLSFYLDLSFLCFSFFFFFSFGGDFHLSSLSFLSSSFSSTSWVDPEVPSSSTNSFKSSSSKSQSLNSYSSSYPGFTLKSSSAILAHFTTFSVFFHYFACYQPISFLISLIFFFKILEKSIDFGISNLSISSSVSAHLILSFIEHIVLSISINYFS